MPDERRVLGQRGQATVEFALLLPLVALLLAVILQSALVVRDQLGVTHAAGVAGRAVIVRPTLGAARTAISRSGLRLAGLDVSLSGDRSRGSLVRVTVRARPTRVPLVGRALSGVQLSEALTVQVE